MLFGGKGKASVLRRFRNLLASVGRSPIAMGIFPLSGAFKMPFIPSAQDNPLLVGSGATPDLSAIIIAAIAAVPPTIAALAWLILACRNRRDRNAPNPPPDPPPPIPPADPPPDDQPEN